VFANDGEADDIQCGDGRDSAVVDKKLDNVTECEKVTKK
jgi:hypothetical protein